VFLVELTPGRERFYGTRAEFVGAIRAGEITAGSRIFHRATARWISITEHPEYRRFQAGLEPPTEPPMRPERRAPQPLEKRGWLEALTGMGSGLGSLEARTEFHLSHGAASGWARLKRLFQSGRTRRGPARRPAKHAEPPESAPTRSRWTFLP
jgi:hypothetical protein